MGRRYEHHSQKEQNWLTSTNGTTQETMIILYDLKIEEVNAVVLNRRFFRDLRGGVNDLEVCKSDSAKKCWLLHIFLTIQAENYTL